MLQDEEGREQEGGEHDIEPVCFDVSHDVFLCLSQAPLLDPCMYDNTKPTKFKTIKSIDNPLLIV